MPKGNLRQTLPAMQSAVDKQLNPYWQINDVLTVFEEASKVG